MTDGSETLIPFAHGSQPRCFGCGMESAQGLRLEFAIASDQSIVCNTVVASCFEGPPGCVHGGIIATLLDEAMSKAVRQLGIRAMTRSMSVDYRRPVPVDHPIRIVGRLLSSHERHHQTEARILNAQGVTLASATGVFAQVRALKMERATESR